MDIISKFNNLADFYDRSKRVMDAICAIKGGLDKDNYSGRFFVNDLLEIVCNWGEEALKIDNSIKPRVSKYQAEFAKISKDTTPSNKPIYKMSLEEFLKTINLEGRDESE
jgi:hypothetical protein